jgi:snurportin-1
LQRRAQLIESERHIDLLADLNLGDSDPDDDEAEERQFVHEGVGHLAALVQPSSASTPASSTPLNAADTPDGSAGLPAAFGGAQKHRKTRRKKATKRVSPWADQCMYAELLELSTDGTRVSIDQATDSDDALPADLESAWVAVAPVPAGKRCLAVCQQGSGYTGIGTSSTPCSDLRQSNLET